MNEKLLLNEIASIELKYHINNKKGLDQNIFRPGSTKFFELFREARDLYELGLYDLNENEELYIKNTNLGEFGLYENELVPLDFPMSYENENINEDNLYKGKKVKLNKPKRGGNKKFYVYTKNPKTGNIIKVEFGDKNMKTGLNNPARVKSFVARHRCKTHANDKTKPSYWSCRLPRYFGNSGKQWW